MDRRPGLTGFESPREGDIMARTAEITLPSGLIVEIRNMKVSDEDAMTGRNAQRDPLMWNQLLSAVVVDVKEVPGPYPGVSVGDPLKAIKLYTGDRMALLLYVRRLTYGDNLDFDWSCDCGELIQWSCDLSLLPVKPFPESTVEKLRDGIQLEAWLPDAGVNVTFRLTTGEDETKLARKRSKNRSSLISDMIMLRLLSLDSEKPRRRDVLELSGFDGDSLREDMEAADGGVDVEIEVSCPACGRTRKINLPFDGSFFSRPKKMKRTLGLRPGESETGKRKSGPETESVPMSPGSE